MFDPVNNQKNMLMYVLNIRKWSTDKQQVFKYRLIPIYTAYVATFKALSMLNVGQIQYAFRWQVCYSSNDSDILNLDKQT